MNLVMTAMYQEDFKSCVELVLDETEESLHATHSSLKTSHNVMRHKCASILLLVGQELKWLRQDFDHHLRNILFYSQVVAVLCALPLCCIAQIIVRFEFYVVILHFIVLLWARSLTLYVVHAFPSIKYSKLFTVPLVTYHWDHVVTDNFETNLQLCPNTFWKQGALICSNNEICRARSDVNSAEPGSIHHERFIM